MVGRNLKTLATRAFESAYSSGVLASLGRDVVDRMASDMSGGDDGIRAAAVDAYRTQAILGARDALVGEDEAEARALHAGVRETMLRTLGVTGDEYARARVDERLGDTSTMLAMKEAYVFR